MDKESLEHDVVSKGVSHGGLSVVKTHFGQISCQVKLADIPDFLEFDGKYF